MMTPLEKTMEELESIGEENTRGKRMISRTVAASLMSVKIETKLQFIIQLSFSSYRWPGSVMYYTIDSAFDEDERAVIASGFAHVSERTCITCVCLYL